MWVQIDNGPLYTGVVFKPSSRLLMILPLAFSAKSWGIWMSCSPSSSMMRRLVSPWWRIWKRCSVLVDQICSRPPALAFLRHLSQTLNRFLSADSIIPSPTNPQSYNRYTYTLNNPIKYSDPTGHAACSSYEGSCAISSLRELPKLPVSDARSTGHIVVDEAARRSEQELGNSHFDNDWAGRVILERYLLGQGDWTITNDPNWSRYMMENDRLQNTLQDRVADIAQNMHSNGMSQFVINEEFLAQMENGEGIVGYQYLHGTNKDVGNFQIHGFATVSSIDENAIVFNLTYTWNDIIDPNSKYRTDIIKSTIAEIITLGLADPYTLQINWSIETVIWFDDEGNINSFAGWPGETQILE